ESPAARRSENSARCWAGLTKPPKSRHASRPAMPRTSTNAIITEPLAPLGREPRSKMDTPPDCLPALYASPITANRTTLLSSTSVQAVELSRDFMLPPNFPTGAQPQLQGRSQISNAGSRKNLEQSPQIDNQSQAVIVPKHANAVRHIFRCLFQEIIGVDGIRADDLVRRNAHP